MPLRNLLILCFSAIFSLVCYQTAVRSRYASTIAEALSIIDDNYLERIDDRELFEGAMNGMIDKLDQHSQYIPPTEFSQFQESLEQEFGGIGVVVELKEEEHAIEVMSPLVGTPAYRAGIRAGDRILAIDDTVVAETPLKDAVGLMRGRPGSEVTLRVLHPGEEQSELITVQREIIPVHSVLGDRRADDGTWKFTLEEHPRIGYIRLTTFGDQTDRELAAALEQLEGKTDGLILDLRDNAGGYLTTARSVCDMFIDEGLIVSTRGRDDQLRDAYYATSSGTAFPLNKPMAVLVNNFSASAAEIVAACLQDHNRAVIVGTRTYGKGTVQNVVKLEGGTSALKLTTASYWRPSNRNIHRFREAPEDGDWGVRPDPGMKVELDDAALERLARWRRARDFPNRNEAEAEPPPEATPPEGSVEATPASDPLPMDPQLARAIEYIVAELE